jgi:hypothetical protein
MNEGQTTREILINSILELSGDEFESKSDLIELAKETERELIIRIINIANHYKLELEKY